MEANNYNGGYNGHTQMLLPKFLAPLNSTATWRTLLRGYVNGSGRTNDLGYYENGGANFVDGFNVNSIPNYTTQFN